MFRQYLTLFLFWCTSCLLLAQGIGTWTPHLAYHHATQSIAVDNQVYALYEENFLSYRATDGEVRRYSRADGMNGKAIQSMGHSATTKQIVLLYADGIIDLFNPQEERFFNLNYLKENAHQTGAAKQLNVAGNYATVVTEKGIALYNVSRKELRGFYALPFSIVAATVFNGYLYLATPTEIKAGALTANLYDATQWQTVVTKTASQLLPFGNQIYLLTPSEGLWQLSGGNQAATSHLAQISPTTFTSATFNGQFAVFRSPTTLAVYPQTDPTTPTAIYALDNTFHSLVRTANGQFWAAEGKLGLVGYTATTTLQANGERIGGYGPAHDAGGVMHFLGNRLLIAGGRFSPSFSIHLPGTAMYYEDNRWTNFQEEGVGTAIGWAYENVTGVAQDPKDPTHHYVSLAERGLLEFKDGKYVRRYFEDNSPLRRYLTYGARLQALQYDNEGRLWMTNNGTDTIFRLLLPDGKWSSLYVNVLKGFRHIKNFHLDSKGRIWAISAAWHGPYTGGVACIDTKGTPLHPADDAAIFRNFMTNTEGARIDLQHGVSCLVEDLGGQLWFGSKQGVFVISSPDEFLNADWRVEQPKVARGDGTTLADYLLADIEVTAIAVDGANRKWIGTAGAGVYLVSPDGTEILEHFTTTNSLLLSNDIHSIATNMETGEVFFGTEAGIISYVSDATKVYDTLSNDHLKIYPNPIARASGGKVAITGLTPGANVKIMTLSGFAVAAGKASSGAFQWDLRSPSGDLVAAGVYYILIATEDGKAGIVGKVVVV